MQILKEIFKDLTKKGKSPKDVFVKQSNSFNDTMATRHGSRGLSTSFNQPHTVSTMIATGIISNMMVITELQTKSKVALHNLKGFSALFPLGLYLSL